MDTAPLTANALRPSLSASRVAMRTTHWTRCRPRRTTDAPRAASVSCATAECFEITS
jgi:hypothetical protein